MNQILEQHFIKKYPKIFAKMYGDPRETCMAFGIACGDGWFHLLDDLCNSIQHHIDSTDNDIKGKWVDESARVPQVVFAQVKEKFGALRIYFDGGDDYVKHIVMFTESVSTSICENCGIHNEHVGRTKKGWIQSLCVGCASEYQKVIRLDTKKINLWKRNLKSRKNVKRSWKTLDEMSAADLKELQLPLAKRKKRRTK